MSARKPKKSVDIKLPSFSGGRKRDVLFFTQELSTLLSAGVPVDRALSITAELTDRPTFRALVLDILRVLKGGRTLADSLATHPDHFSELYINMVRAGEAGGSLAVVFERLSEFERTRDDLRSYILSSMAYPTLLSLVGVGSILVLMNFVVPRFAAVFEESRIEMPLPTKMLLVGSKFLQSYGWLGITLLVVFAIGMYTYVRTVPGRLWWDTLRLKIPVLGDALRKAETARFARAMATLGIEQRTAGTIARHRRRNVEQSPYRGIARKRVLRSEARRRHCRALAKGRAVPSPGGPSVERGRRNRPAGFDVRADGRHLRRRHSRGHS